MFRKTRHLCLTLISKSSTPNQKKNSDKDNNQMHRWQANVLVDRSGANRTHHWSKLQKDPNVTKSCLGAPNNNILNEVYNLSWQITSQQMLPLSINIGTRQQNFHDNGTNVCHHQQIWIFLQLGHQKYIQQLSLEFPTICCKACTIPPKSWS